MIVSPGDSLVPASIDPNITHDAPAAMALAMSPVYFTPPSAITGTLFFILLQTSRIAENCGTPTPATILVVQMEPGPIPTLIPSAPAFNKNFAASAVATLPTTISTS